jgi:hypothetical protein
MEKSNDNWTLSHLTITQDWAKPSIFNGNIKFKNGVKMEMALMLDDEKCRKLMSILRDEVIESANTLGDMMVKSMPQAITQSTTEQLTE